MRYAPLVSVASLLGLCSCMHTELGGNPELSPDKQYAIGTRAYGASGKAYSAQTKKRFQVWIVPKTGSNPAPAFKKMYVFVAADMGWKVNWHDSEEVAVDLYDARRATDAQKSSAPSNHVASLLFRKAPDGRFVQVR